MRKTFLFCIIISIICYDNLLAQPVLYGLNSDGGSDLYGSIFKIETNTNTLSTEYSFQNNPNSPARSDAPILASNGKIYGMTEKGGSGNFGTIYSYDPVTKIFTKVHDFDNLNGANPRGGIIQANDGKLYGVTYAGGAGNGTLFSFDISSNSFIKLINFTTSNGKFPVGSLVQASDGKLYGMTFDGGANSVRTPGGIFYFGTIFSYDIVSNTLAREYSFSSSNGNGPVGSLVEGPDQKLYGLTPTKGSNSFGSKIGQGIIFSFDPSTKGFSNLFNFTEADGYRPWGSLIIGQDGRLFGMTSYGGTSGKGTIFSYDLSNNTFNKLFDFNDNTGQNPQGSFIETSDGKLYAMTQMSSVNNPSGRGTIFSFNPSDLSYSTLHEFNITEGTDPTGSLLKDNSGKLLGTTQPYRDYSILFSYEPTASSFEIIHAFANESGFGPRGKLVQAPNGKFYGVSTSGGNNNWGTIFSFEPTSGTVSKIHDINDLNDGYGNSSGLIRASNGKLYGLSSAGGFYDHGTIYSIDPANDSFSKLYDFESAANGVGPFGRLVQANNGKLYGMAGGGINDLQGVLFSFDPTTNIYAKVFDFLNTNFNGGSLINSPDGLLYGTLVTGGWGGGSIFSFDPNNNTFTNRIDFSGNNYDDPIEPSGQLQIGSDGLFYGMTQKGGINNYGAIISYNPNTNTITKLYDFDIVIGRPFGSLLKASDGKYYGRTVAGANLNSRIFSFDPSSLEVTILQDLFTKINSGNATEGFSFAEFITAPPSCIAPEVIINSNNPNSFSENLQLTVSGANTYSWSGPDGFTSTLSNPLITNLSVAKFGVYTVIGSNGVGCNDTATVTFTLPVFFRSSQSGKWTDSSSWEFSSDSIIWVAANRYPKLYDTTILIQNGHEVTTNGFLNSGDNIVVSNGGIFTIAVNTSFNFSTAASNNNRPIFEVNGRLNVFGSLENRQSFVVNGLLNVENGTIRNLDGGKIFINGICDLYSGNITKGGSLSPVPAVIVNSSGVLNLLSDNPKTIAGPINYGIVNWNRGDLSFETSLPENYGIWRDSSTAYFTSRRLNFKNFGIYNKLGGNSYAQSNSYNFTNSGLLRGFGIMDLGQGGIATTLGRLSPGDSIGSLTLKFRQPMTLDELSIQLGDATGPGTGHDILTFYGNLTLSGTLNVEELNSLPEGNYTIVRKDSGSLSGTFATTNLPANYSLQYFTDSVVLVKIQSVPPKNISITNPTAITEGNSGSKELKFVLRLNQVSTGTVKVNYTTADSTATAGEDYTAISGTIAIPAGTLTDTIRVPILGDKLVEPFERIKVLLSNPVNGIITTGLAIGTINNDDALPALSITNYTLSEGTTRDSLLQVQVRLSASYPLPVTVNYATQDSTATDGIDYSGAIGTLTFQPGDTLEFIPVLIKADGIDEGNEILHINLSAVSNATLAATTRGRITINDDDNIPVITLGNVSITEGNTTDTLLQVKVRLSRSYILPVTINYSTFDSTATQGNDYTGGSGTLTFQPGDTLEYIPVLIKGDRIDEPNEIINIAYSNPVNGVLPTTVSRVTITDNDLLPAVTFTNLTLTEGNNDQFNTATVTVRLNRSYPLPVSVNYTLLDSTAVNGSDYQSVQGTLNFAAEDTLENISFPILGDRVVETSEIIKLIFSSPVNATATSVPYRIAIGNDDSYPAVSVTAPAVTEGDAGTVNQALTVRLSKRYPQPVSVQLSTAALTALSGTDYILVNTTLTFPADGDTLQTVTIIVLGDLLDEANETYRVQLTTPVNATVSGTGIITATINDNDAGPAIRIYDSSATENSGSIVMRVAMNTVSGRQVKVAYRTVAGTAVQTLDYQPVVTDTLVFNAGETVKYIIIPVLTDALTELNENFSVVLSGPVNSTVTTSLGGDNTGVATIINSESAGAGLNLPATDRVLSNVTESLQVKVLPNPSRNYFQLNITGNGKGTLHLRVTDMLGRVLEERKSEGMTQQIKIGEKWINGTYVLDVIQGDERKTIQLVKLR